MPDNSNYINQLKSVSNYADDIVYSIDDSLSLRKDIETSNDVGGTVHLERLDIEVKDGRNISFLDVMQGIIVEESMFSSFISGTIKILDLGAVLEKFMIRGGETIKIKLRKTKNGDILVWREDLIVTKISSAEMDVVSGQTTFILHFAPRTYINSLKTCLFKSYKNQSITDAALSIYGEISQNDLFIEDSRTTLSNPFISAGFMPHKALDYLAQRACTKDKYFVFFERFVPTYGNLSDSSPFTSSHYFGSVERLTEESKNLRIKTIVFSPKLSSTSESAVIRASRFTTKDNYNHIPAMQLGFYNSKITSINPVTKQVTHQKLSYTDSRESTKDFYDQKLIDDANIFSIYDDIQNQIPGRKVIAASINDSVAKESWLKNHIYGYIAKNYFKINVEIQGGTNKISVGHIVNFFTPSAYDKILNPSRTSPMADLMHSGKYIVTNVVHAIGIGTYTKTLELTRASMPYDVNRNTILESSIEEITKDIFGDRRT